MPTATVEPAKTGTWGVGPAAVLLTMKGPWVVGALLNQIWPFYDRNDKPKTNVFLFQWFVNYNFGKGWAITAAPTNTANWDAEKGQRWTVPFGIGISRTTVFNRRPINLGVQYYSNVKRPTGAPASQLRILALSSCLVHRGSSFSAFGGARPFDSASKVRVSSIEDGSPSTPNPGTEWPSLIST